MEPLTDRLTFAQREKLEQRVPALRQLRLDYIKLCEDCARALLSGIDIELIDTKRQNFLVDMVKQQQELFKTNKIDISKLDAEYECILCRDTGTVLDGGIKRPCQCRIQQLQQKRSAKIASLSRFSDFDTKIFSDSDQKEKTLRKKIQLENYARNFPNNDKPHILLVGNPGLGKTFLLGCLVRAIHEKGVRVEMLPAYELFEGFRKQHMGETYILPKLSQVPFLAIDDLGVEPMYRNITVEYFNELLDLRLTRNLPTAIATNLDATNLKEKYGERIVSRLYDQNKFSLIGLSGQSLR